MKTNRKSIMVSAVALLMCCVMFVGATFAWFTDSVVNTGNTIKSGNLAITATAYDLGTGGQSFTIAGVNSGNPMTFEAVGQDLKADKNPIIKDTLWEPGISSAKLLDVKNTGSLAAKIKLDFNVTNSELINALWFDFVMVDMDTGSVVGTFAKRPMSEINTIAQNLELKLAANGGRSSFIFVYGMNEEAGNEFKDKSFALDVSLIATQDTVESDGFNNNQYDKDATYPVSDESDLIAAIGQANDGDTIALTNNIVLNDNITINNNITIDGMGNGVVSNKPITVQADVTFKDITLKSPTNDNKNATLVYAHDGSENIIFEGVTFEDPQWEAIQITSGNFKNLVINNCTFSAANVQGAPSAMYGNTADEAIRFIHIEPDMSDNVIANITITNNTFKNCNKIKDSVVGIYYVDGSTITVGGNTFEDLEDTEGYSSKLSVGWPEEEELKTVANWTGELKTFSIN